MKKPEKKIIKRSNIATLDLLIQAEKDMAYNQAVCDYEKFLPSEKEIEAMAGDVIESWVINSNNETIDKIADEIAKAIYRRIGGAE